MGHNEGRPVFAPEYLYVEARAIWTKDRLNALWSNRLALIRVIRIPAA
jgi:hypothetical protein